MTEPGKLILIIGTSSTGKSTVATALQAKLDDHWLLTGIDQFFQMVNPAWGGGVNGPLSKQGFRYERQGELLQITHGSVGLQILKGMVEAAGAIVRTGNNLIFDDMILSVEHWLLWQSVLEKVDATIIRLDAPAPVLKMREVVRGREEKHHGLALGHYLSNKVPLVDLHIDTSEIAVEIAVEKIRARVEVGV